MEAVEGGGGGSAGREVLTGRRHPTEQTFKKMETFNNAFAELNETFDAEEQRMYGRIQYIVEDDELEISFPTLRYEEEHAEEMEERVELLRTHLAHLPRSVRRLHIVTFNGDDDGSITEPSEIRNEVLRILTGAMREGQCFREIQTSLVYEYDFDVATFCEFMAAAAFAGVESFMAFGTLRTEDGTDIHRARAGVLAVLSTAREFMLDLEMNVAFEERGDLWRAAMASNPRLETLAFGGGIMDSAIYTELVEGAGMSTSLRNLHLLHHGLGLSSTLVEPLRTALAANPLLRSVMLEGIESFDEAEDSWFIGEPSPYDTARALVDEFRGLSLCLSEEMTKGWDCNVTAECGGVLIKSPVSVALEAVLAPAAVAAGTPLPCMPQTTVWGLCSVRDTIAASLPDTLLPPVFPTRYIFDEVS